MLLSMASRKRQTSPAADSPAPSPSEARLNPDEPIPAIEKLPIRQKAFVRALTSPDSATYGNQSRSYQVAYQPSTYAPANATRLISNAKVATAIREEIEAQGLGAKVRVGVIRDVIAGRHRAHTETKTRKLEDGTVVTETESSPRAQDVLRGLAILDRWDGSDAARQAEAQVHVTALRELTKRVMSTLSPPGTGKASKGRARAQDLGQDGQDGVQGQDNALLGQGEGMEGSLEGTREGAQESTREREAGAGGGEGGTA